ESATVVSHFQANAVVFKGQRGLKYFRIGMFERVGQSLLLNAQQVFLNGRHQPASLAMPGELTSKSRSRRHLLDQAVQGDTHIAVLQRLWTERSDRTSSFAETLPGQFAGTTIVCLAFSRRTIGKGVFGR